MTPGQIAQLQDLSKCYMPSGDRAWFVYLSNSWEADRWSLVFRKAWKKQLRRLTHLYRHQIAAIKRNQA